MNGRLGRKGTVSAKITVVSSRAASNQPQAPSTARVSCGSARGTGARPRSRSHSADSVTSGSAARPETATWISGVMEKGSAL